MDNLSSVLVDSEREISRVTSSLDLCHAEGGFVRPECYNQYVSFIKFIMWTVFFWLNFMITHNVFSSRNNTHDFNRGTKSKNCPL